MATATALLPSRPGYENMSGVPSGNRGGGPGGGGDEPDRRDSPTFPNAEPRESPESGDYEQGLVSIPETSFVPLKTLGIGWGSNRIRNTLGSLAAEIEMEIIEEEIKMSSIIVSIAESKSKSAAETTQLPLTSTDSKPIYEEEDIIEKGDENAQDEGKRTRDKSGKQRKGSEKRKKEGEKRKENKTQTEKEKRNKRSDSEKRKEEKEERKGVEKIGMKREKIREAKEGEFSPKKNLDESQFSDVEIEEKEKWKSEDEWKWKREEEEKWKKEEEEKWKSSGEKPEAVFLLDDEGEKAVPVAAAAGAAANPLLRLICPCYYV